MYFVFVIFCVLTVIVVNLAFNFSLATAFNLLISFAFVLLPSLFPAIIIRLLPKDWFDYNNNIYKVSEKEKNFLVKIGIRNWKDKIPELGGTAGFKKDSLANGNDILYLKKFISETVYGEVLHICCIIFALLSLLFVPRHLVLTMALPIAIIYSFLNIPSILIQRYNRPRLIKQLTRLERNQKNQTDLTLQESDNRNEEIEHQKV